MVMENLCLDLRLRRRLHDFVAGAVFGKSRPMKICHPMSGTGHFQTMITYCALPVDKCHTVVFHSFLLIVSQSVRNYTVAKQL